MGKTSTESKRKYIEKAYKTVLAEIEKELVLEWEEKLKIEGISKAEFIRRAMKEYLNK